MTDSLKVAAKAGDIKALEALMNKSFEPKGVTVRVTNSGSKLKILLRGKEGPDVQLSALAKQVLSNIKPKSFDQASIIARANNKSTIWTDEWSLTGSDTSPKVMISKESKNVPSERQDEKLKGQNITLIAILIGLIGVVGWFVFQRIKPDPGVIAIENATEELRQTIEETDRQIQESSSSESALESTTIPQASDTFSDAVRSATQAANSAQTAKTSEEWADVARLWSEAIRYMQEVPASSTNYTVAQAKANEYQANFSYAQQQETRELSTAQPQEPVKEAQLTPDIMNIGVSNGGPVTVSMDVNCSNQTSRVIGSFSEGKFTSITPTPWEKSLLAQAACRGDSTVGMDGVNFSIEY